VIYIHSTKQKQMSTAVDEKNLEQTKKNFALDINYSGHELKSMVISIKYLGLASNNSEREEKSSAIPAFFFNN